MGILWSLWGQQDPSPDQDGGSAPRDDVYSPDHQRRPGHPDEPQRHIPKISPWRSMNWSDDTKTSILRKIRFKFKNNEEKPLRILLHGPVGAGKSSFFNSVDSCLVKRITNRALEDVATGTSFTLKLNSYTLKKGNCYFKFIDTRGIERGKYGILSDDLIKILQGHIKDGYTFKSETPIHKNDPNYNRNPSIQDRIHCMVAVLPADTVSFMEDDFFQKMRKVREAARDLSIPQVIVMTKVDLACPLVKNNLTMIYTSNKIKQKVDECNTKLGVSTKCIFPVKNYHEERDTNLTTDILILDAFERIANSAISYMMDSGENA